SGQIKALIVLAENPLDLGITVQQLSNLPAFVLMNILANESTEHATALLPSYAFAEKRGSMINGKGRLQRLNRAVRGPGQARDDWEILRDLIQAISAETGSYTIEDVFREMSAGLPEFSGLTLSRISDLGVQTLKIDQSPGPPEEPA